MPVKLLSSLEKCFWDEALPAKAEYSFGSCLANERFHFTAALTSGNDSISTFLYLQTVSPLSDCISVRAVESIPVHAPCNPISKDENYLRIAPGLYPDLLLPLPEDGRLVIGSYLNAVYVEVDPAGRYPAGEYPIELRFLHPDGSLFDSVTFTLEIIGASLPEQTLIHTEWFHCDCLQDYYRTESFDERHWQIIENFLSAAVKRGVNMILTPILTPALDTHIGGERTTTQLVDVTVENGVYHFDFSKLDRWVALCNKLGIKYFEISHFFTQWGAAHAPKVMATVDGEYKRLFGWDTDASGEEYKAFLFALIPALLDFMRSKNGADKRCWFHISDEPGMDTLAQYQASRNMILPLLKGYPIIDALSHYEFYEQGIVTKPIPASDHIEPFLENQVPGLWTYYCCSQNRQVSNRFIAMPSARTRVIGMQLFKFGIEGFLHWGFNFYNNQGSYRSINPFTRTDGEYFVPAGDPFLVYPAPDGTPYESLRLLVFEEGLQDMRALQLCQSLIGREHTLAILEDGIDPITFSQYPHNTQWLLDTREKINQAIKAAL